jgi:hypothetical protein
VVDAVVDDGEVRLDATGRGLVLCWHLVHRSGVVPGGALACTVTGATGNVRGEHPV